MVLTDLFELAKGYEKINPETSERYTWAQGESLSELGRAERTEEIKRNHLSDLSRRTRDRFGQGQVTSPASRCTRTMRQTVAARGDRPPLAAGTSCC